jgi:hypothetical protein
VVVPWWCRVGDALRSCSKTSSAGGQPEKPGAGHLFAATRRHGVVRPQPGGLNQRAASPTCGGLAILELAAGCVRSGSHSVLARQRISPSRKP